MSLILLVPCIIDNRITTISQQNAKTFFHRYLYYNVTIFLYVSVRKGLF
jgi:hypothetical protein